MVSKTEIGQKNLENYALKPTEKTKKKKEFEPPQQLVALNKGVGINCAYCGVKAACWWVDERGRLYCHACVAKYADKKLEVKR